MDRGNAVIFLVFDTSLQLSRSYVAHKHLYLACSARFLFTRRPNFSLCSDGRSRRDSEKAESKHRKSRKIVSESESDSTSSSDSDSDDGRDRKSKQGRGTDEDKSGAEKVRKSTAESTDLGGKDGEAKARKDTREAENGSGSDARQHKRRKVCCLWFLAAVARLFLLIAHASSKRLACWFGKLSLNEKARHNKWVVQCVFASSRNVRLQSPARQRDRSKRSRRSSSSSGSATDGSSSDSDSGDAKSGEDEAEACFQGVRLMFSRVVIQRSILVCLTSADSGHDAEWRR
jgi:hypothetical protein